MYGIYEATGALRFETRQATIWIFIWCLQVITVITPSIQNKKKNIYRNDPIDLALLLPTVHHDDPIWTEQHQIKTLKVPQSAPLVRVIWYWSICSGKWPYCITNSCWFGGIFKPILWMWSIIIKEGNEWLEAIKIETNALSIHQVIGFILVVKVVLTLVGHLRFLFSGFQL